MNQGYAKLWRKALDNDWLKKTEIEELKKALREAIFSTKRTIRRTIEYDPGAGSTYSYDWRPEVKQWAKLCDLDLDN